MILSSGENFVFDNPLAGFSTLKRWRPVHRVTFSISHVDTSRKSPYDVPWETRLSIGQFLQTPDTAQDMRTEIVLQRPVL